MDLSQVPEGHQNGMVVATGPASLTLCVSFRGSRVLLLRLLLGVGCSHIFRGPARERGLLLAESTLGSIPNPFKINPFRQPTHNY